MNYPKIYDPSGNLLAVMDNVIEDTDTLHRKLNADFTFEFEAFEKELKSEFIVADNLVEVEGQRFEIKYIDDSHEIDDSIVLSAECEHVSYRLISDDLTFYAFTGTPTAILTDILSGTDFSVGTVEFSTPFAFIVNEETTKFRVIQLLAAELGAEIEYTALGFTINLLDSLGADNGFEIRTGKNLRSIKRVIDNRGQLKTYYSVNMIELKNSDLYIKNGFDVLEVVELGDTIKVIDPRMNIDIQNKIISRTWNPIKSVVSKVELSNSIELLTDEMVSFEVNSVNKNEIIYGVQLNNQDGFVTERTDQLAKSVFNADEFAMKKGDGFGGYTNAVYFDTVDEEYKFVGDIDATGTITGGAIVGGTIDIGANFSVDASGNMIADNGEFSGDITGSIFTGGTFRSAASGQRIEIKDNDFSTYNSSEQREGVQILNSDSFNSLSFFDSGVAQAVVGFDPVDDLEITAFGSNEITIQTNVNSMIFQNGGSIDVTSTGDINLNTDTSSILIQDGADVRIDADDDVLISASDDISLSNISQIFYMNKGSDSIDVTSGTFELFLDNEWDATVNGQSLIFNESTQEISLQIFSGELEVFDGGVYQFTCSTKP